MAKQRTLIQVFVASPGDVSAERELLQELVTEFNLTWGDTLSAYLELVRWETHSRPAFGADAQDEINQQIGDQYDIFIGIMWSRFGTATGRAESGTEEEFERAYARLQALPASVQIMFYFKDTPIPPSEIDASQLSKVNEFRKKIGSQYGGLYHGFNTIEEFLTKARIHLSKAVQQVLHGMTGDGVAQKTVSGISDAREASRRDEVIPTDPLANLSAVQYDGDEGAIELEERATSAMASITRVLDSMNDATTSLGERIEIRANELNSLAERGVTRDSKEIKRVANDAAADMEQYVVVLSNAIPEFHREHSNAMDAFSKIAVISSIEFEVDKKELEDVLAQILFYDTTIMSTIDTLTKFRDTMSAVPRMTTTFGRAKKRAVAVTDDLLAQFESAYRQADDVRQLLQRLLDPLDDEGDKSR